MVKWVLFLMLMVKRVIGEPMVPCFFIFGDSLSDSGNNNDLETDAKVNYPPYGIDFPGGVPTGRFCNGKTSVDFLAEFMGFDHLIPPYANASGRIILQGVNYASGSAGILNETGKHLGENVELHKQLVNHGKTILNMFKYLNRDKYKVTRQLNRCLYSVGIGSNDYLNNYFMPKHYDTSKKYNIDEYAEYLIQQYSEYIKSLYRVGARKIFITGLGNVGCIPFVIDSNLDAINRNGTDCVEKINEATFLFNQKLAESIDDLNKSLRYAKFVYINSTALAAGSAPTAGFTDFKKECCRTKKDGQCKEEKEVCPNRKRYVFWDSFHPTEASNQISASIVFNNSSPSITFPYDLRTLAAQPS